MKNAIITILAIMTICGNTNAHTHNISSGGALVHWPSNQVITITIDPTINMIRTDAADITEDVFMRWLDYVDADIVVDFVHAQCDASTLNCVSYDHSAIDGTYEGIGVNYNRNWWADTGEITNSSVKIYPRMKVENFESTMLHEAGHFWGMEHSDNPAAVMYPYNNSDRTELHQDDINGIMTIYGDGAVYPTIKPDKVDYSFQGCSINAGASKKTIWSLIF